MDDLIVLITAEPGKDADGYLELKIKRKNSVFGEVGSPKRAQRDSAMRHGYNATLKVKVNSFEYNSENYIRYNNRMYEIKEVYELDKNYLEFTCSDLRCGHGKL